MKNIYLFLLILFCQFASGQNTNYYIRIGSGIPEMKSFGVRAGDTTHRVGVDLQFGKDSLPYTMFTASYQYHPNLSQVNPVYIQTNISLVDHIDKKRLYHYGATSVLVGARVGMELPIWSWLYFDVNTGIQYNVYSSVVREVVAERFFRFSPTVAGSVGFLFKLN